TPSREQLETVLITDGRDPAQIVIEKAIRNRDKNDPEKVLPGFKYRSYSKFIIDNEFGGIEMAADSTSAAMQTIINEGRAYLSEKISEHYYTSKKNRKEQVLALQTAGFEEPVYNVLGMKLHPLSLYKRNYKLYETEYAGPLADNAFRNYDYKILDTTSTSRPAYMVYFKPKREKVFAGLEGVLYLDTISFAIQKASAQLLGAIKLQVEHNYEYYPDKDIWFPSEQSTRIRPGAGGKEIAVFGGTITVGSVQQKEGVLNVIFGSQEISRNLYLYSISKNYDIDLDHDGKIENPGAEIEVEYEATRKDSIFWQNNRKLKYTTRDEATKQKVDSLIRAGNVARKLEVKKAMASGSYPLGFWDVDLSKIFKFNNYEGIRLGFGGRTNDRFSEDFNLNGYTTYGFKDEVLKYGAGTEIYLNRKSGTNLNFNFSRDIRETASFDYLKGQNTFAILQPRFVNINFYHNYRKYSTGLEHRITPKFDAEIQLAREEIWQIRDYSYLNDGQIYRDYDLATVTFSFLWRPFSRFLNTPESNIVLEKNFPQFTGQIEQSFSNFGGTFDFTRIGLKAEHEIARLDRSRTEFILEGNYGYGDLPLTHAFHANPNNPGREGVFRRFSIAGRNSFETMFFNEFFSDRQASLQIRHQLRPFLISDTFQPELVFIHRYAIGDFADRDKHQNISFNTLDHGYSEAGLELNKILAGLGLAAAYRYGAYNLDGFKDNFAFKFTWQLQL
ncbi:MAG: carboxypeptidase-like regulatory domain-containing protein, partial [Gramella sp.]|nr:carboxypeptidase-like regulatory domain-containing protein [Christiangramia sp.]